MKKLLLLLALTVMGLVGFSQNVILEVQGQLWYLPDGGYGLDTMQAYIIVNENGAGNAGITIIVGTDTVFLQLDGSGNYYIINRTGDITFIATGGDVVSRENFTIENTNPNLNFKDTDASAGDVNALIRVQATDVGDGTEDIDVTFMQQVAGVSHNFLVSDADGDLTIESKLGNVDIDAIATKDVDISGGQVLISSKENTPSAISLLTNIGVDETISIQNGQGTSSAAIELVTVAGGITLTAGTVYASSDLDVVDNITAGDIIIDEAAGVLKFSGGTTNSILCDDDELIIGGVNGASNNENLIYDFETTANSIDVGTSTGVTKWDFGTIGVESAYLNADDSLTLNGITVDSIITLANATGNAGAPFDTVKTGVIKSNVTTYSVMNGEVTAGGCVTLADDASITLPDAKTQSLVVYVDGDNEWALAAIQADGTVTLPATVGSVVNSDTDTNLCIFDSGTGATIRNRLGSTKTICYTTKYKQ